MNITNFIVTRTDKVRAVCEFCNCKSRPVAKDYDGGPSMWNLPLGWACCPYPADFVHYDGSIGDKWTCPKCNKKLNAGQSLHIHESRKSAYAEGLAKAFPNVHGNKQ